MSNKEVKIEFKTTADTQGAKEAAKEIDKVKEAAKQANAAAEAQTADVRQIRNLQLGQAADTLANNLRPVSDLLREIAKDSQKGDIELSKMLTGAAQKVDVLQGALKGAAAGSFFGLPGAILGAIGGGGFAAVGQEVNGLVASLKHLAAAKELNARLPAIMAAVKKAFDMKEVTATWTALKSEIIATLNEAENASKIRTAEDQARLSLAQQNTRAVELAGGDVDAAEKKEREIKVDIDEAALGRSVADALNRVGAAQNLLDAKNAEIDQKVKLGASEADLDKLREEARRLAEALRQARNDFETAQKTTELQRGINDSTVQNDKVEATQDKTVDDLNRLVEDVQQYPQLSELSKQVLEITQDGKISADEMKKIPGLIQQMVAAMRGTGVDIVNIVQRAMSDLDELRREVSNLKSNMGNPNY